MKRLCILVVTACFLFTVASCGSNKVMNGIEYETYGIFNKEEVRKEGVRYRLVIGNVVWGIILCETVIAPIYFFGFSLYEPVGKIYKDELLDTLSDETGTGVTVFGKEASK